MPKKARAKTKRPHKRKARGKKKDKGTIMVNKTPSNLHMPFPPKFRTKLEYSVIGDTFVGTTSGGGTPVGTGYADLYGNDVAHYSNTINLPNLWGPFDTENTLAGVNWTGTGTGAQFTQGSWYNGSSITFEQFLPQGLFNVCPAPYNKYRVTGSSISVTPTIQNDGANPALGIAIVPIKGNQQGSTQFNLGPQSYQACLSAPKCKYKMYQLNTGTRQALKNYATTHDMYGVRRQVVLDEDDYTVDLADDSAAENHVNNQWFWRILWATNAPQSDTAASALLFNLEVRIMYYIDFEISQSKMVQSGAP